MAYSIEEQLLHANKYSRPAIQNSRITGLVIHWTANTAKGADAMANRNYFDSQDSRQSYASAHYLVDQSRIIRCIPEMEMAYHVGALQYNQDTLKLLGTTYPNDCTIGIEWCVNEGNDFNETWNKVAWLAADICKRHGLDPMTHMIRHYDVTWKDCPHFFTPNVPNGEAGWAKFRAAVKAVMGGAATTAPVATKALDEIGEITGTDSNGLHVRADASSSSEARYTLNNGDKIHIIEHLNTEGHGWYKTSYGDLGGYVWDQFVKIIPQPIPKPIPQPAKPKYTFEDIDGHFAADAIQSLADLDILHGIDQNGHKVYLPDNAITRAEAAVVIARTIHYLIGKPVGANVKIGLKK